MSLFSSAGDYRAGGGTFEGQFGWVEPACRGRLIFYDPTVPALVLFPSRSA